MIPWGVGGTAFVDAVPSLARVVLHGGVVSTEQLELSTFFLVGLLGGAHCLGMCGPLVTMYATEFDGGASGHNDGGLASFREIRQHLLFNVGRTVSYALLGGAFGLAGAVSTPGLARGRRGFGVRRRRRGRRSRGRRDSRVVGRIRRLRWWRARGTTAVGCRRGG